MIPFPLLLSRLLSDEELCRRLHFQTVSRFFDITNRLMPHILTSSPRRVVDLPALPGNIRDVLALSLALSYDDVEKLWTKTGDILLREYETSSHFGDQCLVDEVLSKNAPQFNLGACLSFVRDKSIFLIARRCRNIDRACLILHSGGLPPKRFGVRGESQGLCRHVVHTSPRCIARTDNDIVLSRYAISPLPSSTFASNVVSGCLTMYRPNYYVNNADSQDSVRRYYGGVPKFIEVTQHSYVDEDLVRLF